ncbi:MAG: right-handed parallel beta-helix repeat-containing protein [Planctomycetota bacterium]
MRQVSWLPILVLSILPVLPTTATEPAEPRKGRIFYVRQTVGDDANDGLSPDTAWQSLSMLEKGMRAGDTVYVGPGLYREMLTVANSGTADERINFIADTTGAHTGDPPGVSMIAGADVVDETIFVPQPSTPGLYLAASPEQVRGVVEMDGLQYRYATARDTKEHLREGRSELEVVAKLPSSFFYDRDDKVLYIHTSDGRPPSTHEIELIRRNYGIVTYEKRHIAVIGFTFRHMGTAGINFENGSSNCSAINNTSYGTWQGIRVFNSTDVLVRGNTLFRNGNSGIYFLYESSHGYAIGNVLYENAKGVRWSSGSANGLALDNLAFANHEVGISVENADDIRVSGNVFVDNAISQMFVRKSRYMSEGNCFEKGGAEQLIAHLYYNERYTTLAEYQQSVNQDLGSHEGCGRLPKKIDIHKIHADTSVYTERARAILAKGRRVQRR